MESGSLLWRRSCEVSAGGWLGVVMGVGWLDGWMVLDGVRGCGIL